MKIVDESAIVKVLDEHLEWCDVGPRNCTDCATALGPPRIISSLAVASAELLAIREWLQGNEWMCVYCGGVAQSRDHLVPREWIGFAVRSVVPTVGACLDCNEKINAALVFTIAGRSEIAASRIRSKWGKRLRIPDRSAEDLEEFGYGMRSNLLAAQAERTEIRRRLMVLDVGGAPFASETLLVEAH